MQIKRPLSFLQISFLRRLLALFCGLSYAIFLPAQDSLTYTNDFTFHHGIYLTYQDFLANNPIPKSKIKTIEQQKDRPDYLSQVVARKTFDYQDKNGQTLTVKTHKIWGYSTGRNIYLYPKIRISIIGAICHFTYIQINNYGANSSAVGYQSFGDGSSETISEGIIDFETGEILFFNKKILEEIFQRDPELFQEYKKYKGKKREKRYVFLNRYNKKHPIKFPKNFGHH